MLRSQLQKPKVRSRNFSFLWKAWRNQIWEILDYTRDPSNKLWWETQGSSPWWVRSGVNREKRGHFQDQRHRQESDIYGFVGHCKGLDFIPIAMKGNQRVQNKEKRWGSGCFVEMSYGWSRSIFLRSYSRNMRQRWQCLDLGTPGRACAGCYVLVASVIPASYHLPFTVDAAYWELYFPKALTSKLLV